MIHVIIQIVMFCCNFMIMFRVLITVLEPPKYRKERCVYKILLQL